MVTGSTEWIGVEEAATLIKVSQSLLSPARFAAEYRFAEYLNLPQELKVKEAFDKTYANDMNKNIENVSMILSTIAIVLSSIAIISIGVMTNMIMKMNAVAAVASTIST